MLIAFEGLDGAGKTTQIGLLRDFLEDQGKDVVEVRSPGGSMLGESIRAMFKEKGFDHSNLTTIGTLMAASINDTIEKVINPAIKEGKVVILDRFLWSTYAYQSDDTNRIMIEHLVYFIKRTLERSVDITFHLKVSEDKMADRLAAQAEVDTGHLKPYRDIESDYYDIYNNRRVAFDENIVFIDEGSIQSVHQEILSHINL